MRIIGGALKGRRLISPRSPLVRPVSDKVKEAIFNILGPLKDETVLDLFAGSGSVGLEALSRGAKSALFVESLTTAFITLRKNIGMCGLSQQAHVVRGRLPFVLKRLKNKYPPFRLVFIDPPYDKGLIPPTLAALIQNKLFDRSTRFIIEHSPRESPECEGYRLVDQRKYGQTVVSFLKSLGA